MDKQTFSKQMYTIGIIVMFLVNYTFLFYSNLAFFI